MVESRSVFKPWLYLPPLWSHHLSHQFLKRRGWFFKKKSFKWNPLYWNNLYFENPLGTAGGLDKSAENIKGWWSYGPGFLEIGTVTPLAQKRNSGVILKKNLNRQALWNYMGFPNKGADSTARFLKRIGKPYQTPLFISLGKNRSTPLEKADEDYHFLIKKLHHLADAFIINISSPNTKNLKLLFEKKFFENFLSSIMAVLKPLQPRPPLLLKISPDLSDDDFLRVISASAVLQVSGWVVCNSTSQREFQGGRVSFPSYGGVSGRPLADRSKHLLKLLNSSLNRAERKGKLVVSCGGVLTPADVFERLRMGADLVQVYTALALQGPSFFEWTKNSFQKAAKT